MILIFSCSLFAWSGDFYISSSANSWPDLNASINSAWKFGGSGNDAASGSASKVLTLTCVAGANTPGQINPGTFYFRIIHKEGSAWHSWGGSGSDVAVTLNDPTATITHDASSGNWSTSGSKTFTATDGKTYKILFKANPSGSGANEDLSIYEFSGSTQSISSVSNPGNGLASSAYTVTTTLGGTPVAEERVYVRYSTDNWSSSSLVEGDPSSNSIDINIPSQSAGTTVKYYVFTGVTGISSANADKATILLDNNSGSNYSYYVESGVGAISGDSGFRMLSSPVSGQVLGSLLTNLWTQGMTGADMQGATSNVWTLNVSGQSWTALSDISGSGTSLSAGQGFLIYVFEDTDYDGTGGDLPVNINVSGSENSSDATYGSIGNGDWGLAGNPYLSTIDWDLISKTNISSTVYVWDDAASAYKSWNGSAGGLTNGLIAPYQGFWVQATGGTGSITISTSDKATTAGTLYRISDIQESGSITFDVSSSEFSDQTFISFQSEGESGLDNADAYKLFPLNHSDRLIAVSYADETGLDINNLPYDYGEDILIPFDIMQLQLDGDMYVTQEEEVTFSWDVSNLPDHISLKLIDQITNIETDMDLVSSLSFTTEPKGSFSTSYIGPVGTYPVVGEPRFSLLVSYSALTSGGNIKLLPGEFALHAAYPNPFNPSTTISFDLPETGKVSLNVFDLKGALVGTLLNENKVGGTYQYKWTPNRELASGMYLFELKMKNKTRHQKITYIK
tara:strand:- start:189 stop:2396 length:2208 start_codon:yes stop_codon:yes gene_type:complete